MKWTERRFDEVADFFDHVRIPLSSIQRESRQGEYPYYGAQGVIDRIDGYLFDGEYILIAEDGANLVTRNEPIAQLARGQFWVNNHAHIVQAKTGVSTNYFLNTLINSMNLVGYVTGAAQPKLSQKNLRGVRLKLPPLPTQQRIENTLSAYDDLIENNRRRIQLLEQSARLLYKEWFVHLRFPGHEHAEIKRGVPKGWEVRPLSRCATFLSGGTPSKAVSEYWDGDIPWVSSGELTRPRICEASLRITPEAAEAGSRLVPRNTILAVVRGMSLAKEFRVGITTGTVAFNQDIKALVAERDIDPVYLFSALSEQKEYIRDRATEASHGTKKLDTSVLSGIQILVPPVKWQNRFREWADPINAQWDNLWQQNAKLAAARDLLLPRLMSGELVA